MLLHQRVDGIVHGCSKQHGFYAFLAVLLLHQFILEHLIFELAAHVNSFRQQCACDELQVVGRYVDAADVCIVAVDAYYFVIPGLHVVLLFVI